MQIYHCDCSVLPHCRSNARMPMCSPLFVPIRFMLLQACYFLSALDRKNWLDGSSWYSFHPPMHRALVNTRGGVLQ